MVQEGRAKYADPSSVLRAAVMLLEHIGEIELAKKLDRALDILSLIHICRKNAVPMMFLFPFS